MAPYLTRLLGAGSRYILGAGSRYGMNGAGSRINYVLGAGSRYILGAGSRYGMNGAGSRYKLTVCLVDENLGRAMSTLGSVSVPTTSSLHYGEKPYKRSIYFTVDDLQIPNLPLYDNLFTGVLPVMYNTFYYKNWSLLQRYCCSKDKIFHIKVALENELVAMFVWFLFNDVPPNVKEGVVCALKDICSKTCEATDMDINDESAVHDPTKMSIDQEEFVDALLVDVLCSKDEEVLRQASCCLGFLANWSYRTVSFGNGIQKKLIQLSRKCDSSVLNYILFAISRIGMINEDMREKIIEAELYDGLLRKILRGEYDHNETHEEETFRDYNQIGTLQEEAYYMVYTILEGQCNCEIWEYLKEHVMPAIFSCCFPRSSVKGIGACVIAKCIEKASPHCIKELVDSGCLKLLWCWLDSGDHIIKWYTMKAVENILSVGDADPSKNEYAKMMDDFSNDWEVFCVVYSDSKPHLADLASGIVKKYRPDKYPKWLECQDIWAGGWS